MALMQSAANSTFRDWQKDSRRVISACPGGKVSPTPMRERKTSLGLDEPADLEEAAAFGVTEKMLAFFKALQSGG